MKSNESIDLTSFGMEANKSTTPRNDREQMLIDTIAAVIALRQSQSLQPQSKSFAAVQSKIFTRHNRKFSPWNIFLSASGWAAAAAVTIFYTFHSTSKQVQQTVITSTTEHAGSIEKSIQQAASPAIDTTDDGGIAAMQNETANPNKNAANEKVKLEQRSLIQEIETLRLTISHLEKRDSERLTPTAGVAWPLIVKMTRPGEEDAVIASNNDILHSMLTEPIAAGTELPADNAKGIGPQTSEKPPTATTATPTASAIPIYDPARDKGQLIVNNLPVADENQTYYLWVKTAQSNNPLLVGALPNNINSTSETFDFRLGTTGVIPDSFQITMDGPQNPSTPQSTNIILQGPAKDK
jgi:hypothetical protein